MSALGTNVAIVSLGHACQTSRQIDGHIWLLRKLTGDSSLKKASLPFDWLIGSAQGIGGMLEDRCFLPRTAAGFCADQGRLRLRSHDVIFWHETPLLARPGEPRFRDAQAKFRHTSSRFDQIAKTDRVIAVLSDTQPNLPSIQKKWNIKLVDTTPEDAVELRAAFATFLGRPVEMLMVSRNPRPDFKAPPGFAYYHMLPERGGWAGNGAKWAAVFTEYFEGSKATVEGGSSNASNQRSGVNVEDENSAKSREIAAVTLTQLIIQANPLAPSGKSWDEKAIFDTYRRCFRHVGTISADPRYQP
jgi:hypothetical protein